MLRLGRAMTRIVGMPTRGCLPTKAFVYTRLVSTVTAPTANVVSSWSTEQVHDYCRDELRLDSGDLAILKTDEVNGFVLLRSRYDSQGFRYSHGFPQYAALRR